MEFRIGNRAFLPQLPEEVLAHHLVLSRIRIHISNGCVDIRVIGETEEVGIEPFRFIGQIADCLEKDPNTNNIKFQVQKRHWMDEELPDAIVIRGLSN